MEGSMIRTYAKCDKIQAYSSLNRIINKVQMYSNLSYVSIELDINYDIKCSGKYPYNGEHWESKWLNELEDFIARAYNIIEHMTSDERVTISITIKYND